jgi:NAD(P)-dependent dehydrogenase (short-subunit alcohol dehydrogenase family)
MHAASKAGAEASIRLVAVGLCYSSYSFSNTCRAQMEPRSKGIWFNGVYPCPMLTDMFHKFLKAVQHAIRQMHGVPDPDDSRDVVTFLASPNYR